MNNTGFLSAGLVAALSFAPGCNRGTPPTPGDIDPGSPNVGWVTGSPTAGPGEGGPGEALPSPAEAVEGGTPRWSVVDAALDGWTPMLVDETGDASDGGAEHDLRQVMLVMTDKDVLARFELGAAPKETDLTDMRFWLEQDGRFLTVETKRAALREECTLSEVGTEVQYRIDSCYHISENVVDIAVPRKEMPAIIDLDADFWISGPQVCCSDEARTKPLDDLNASQVVWRVPDQP